VFENAYYSILSPEGCAAILWKDATKAPEAAEALKMSAADLKQLSVIDGIINEPLGGAHTDVQACIKTVKKLLGEKIPILMQFTIEKLLQQRYEKFRIMGVFAEE
jgi:acetyl-CoA carboxylase carboxyl transferase subunit alpha